MKDHIIEKSLLALKSIPKEAYKSCFDNWEKRWRWCVEARGDYFENIIVTLSGLSSTGYPGAQYEKSIGVLSDHFQDPEVHLSPSHTPSLPKIMRELMTAESVALGLETCQFRKKVAEEPGISFGSTQSIMNEILGVNRLNAVLVPKDLTFDQKNARKETASLNLEATTDDPELLKWSFDSETTQNSSEWRFKNEPRPKKARKAPSKVKVMLTVFFDYQSIVHHEFHQQGSTITADSYLSKSWILHHDNVPAHTALKISKFLQDHPTSVYPQPPYSPDLALCDFFFLESSKKVKGSEISEHRRDQSGIEESHEGDPENRLPELFCGLEKKVAEVHRGQRGLL
ncbi:hypothetical protein LAZ67_20000673 [Cordylochernes scorpioides]|uniref:Transposase n=1 Tax=Cordylochernes scorpioides TaxID=51811 RepID=A0ABY6LJH0_9ARAC|nr:hypothetical protein LAZ67_20000673 [Cordylochernes scorpioides]